MKALVQQVVNILETAAGAPGVENSGAECFSAKLTSQLRMSFLCANAGLEESDLSSTSSSLVVFEEEKSLSFWACSSWIYTIPFIFIFETL